MGTQYGELKLKTWFFAVVLCLTLPACQPTTNLPAAPLGDRQALENLAAAYKNLSEHLPVSPSGLTPQGKLKFVREVFKKAGYDYSGTLRALARTPQERLGAYHKDMADLISLPHQGLNEKDIETLYSKEEKASIEKIAALLANPTASTHP